MKAPRFMKGMILPVQLRAIHATRRDIPGLAEDDTYRDFLENQAGVRSSKDLTEHQARQVLAAMRSLATGSRPAAPKTEEPNPRSGLVRRILREAFAAQWDLPTVPGPFDNSLDAKRARVRGRVLAWLQGHYPHLHGTPKRLEAWPMEALQALVEHLKGVAGSKKRWQARR